MGVGVEGEGVIVFFNYVCFGEKSVDVGEVEVVGFWSYNVYFYGW